jgi:uncharacterized membrane protein YdjX (TVP38/TMEM64 family)
MIGCVSAVAFLYLDRNNSVSNLIHSFGASGVIGAVLAMAILCVTPFPSEGLLIMYLKVYGVIWGTLYAWSGFVLASIAIFGVSRYLGSKAIRSWVSRERFDAIDEWIKRKGTIGLLFVRLLPIPALVVNLITGIMPSVSLWKYAWTGAVTIIPYYIAASLIFLGVSRQDMLAFLVGIPVITTIWFLGYCGSRRERSATLWQTFTNF